MEAPLAILGTLFFMFLILAAAVEVILDVFRGVLERVGLTWVRGKVSLDDALKLAAEFSPENAGLTPKIQALKSAAEQLQKKSTGSMAALDRMTQQLTDQSEGMNAFAGELNAIASSVKKQLEQSERERIFILRFLAAVIGCVIVWQSDFYVFRILAQSSDAKAWLEPMKGLQSEWINILVGGLAAAAGSSYWHDKLDKIRNLKAAAQEMKMTVK
jgi:hypothetical protein